MNPDLLPVDELLKWLKSESDPNLVLQKMINQCRINLPSDIWFEFDELNLQQDISEAQEWIEGCINKYPNTKGIYLGLDTLNMKGGRGENVEIGLSSTCDPTKYSDEWAYRCENYGKGHLIKGLYNVSDTFVNESKWTSEENSFTEYMMFLGYSGIIFREVLNEVRSQNDMMNIWGFHDGDLFLLTQNVSGHFSIITDRDFE